MKKICLIAMVFLICAHNAAAQSIQEKRRIEEEKRQGLAPAQEYSHIDMQSAEQPATPVEPEYFKSLLSRKVVFFADACKVMTLLLGRQDEYPDTVSQITFLEENNILPQDLSSRPDPKEPLRKGQIAYMLCRALDIKGGLWIHIFGLSQRYAVKELAFEGIAESGNSRDIISGKELILMLGSSADYLSDKHRSRNLRSATK